nr:CvpA family protein [Sporolactobacillus terrae]
MLLTLILIILLASGLFNGFRRGLILQLVHLASFIIAYIVAFMYFKPLAGTLKFWIPFPTSASESGMFQFSRDDGPADRLLSRDRICDLIYCNQNNLEYSRLDA